MPQILDGTVVRNEILARLKPRIAKLKRQPGLAVVLVGHNPASEVYVRSKIKTCAEVGIFSDKLTPPETITTEELLEFLESELPGALGRVHADDYLHGAGIPASAPEPRSERLTALLALSPAVPDARSGAEFTPLEWQLYLDALPHPTPHETCAALDERFGLGTSRNSEIRSAWLQVALPAPLLLHSWETL